MPRRWAVIVATFLLSVLLYVDRVCISAAKDGVSRDLSLTEIQMGWVFSAFALGYAMLQAPGGWLADRLGPRRVLACIVIVWSAFTGLTSLATTFSTLLVVRFLFGAGEAGAFPGIARAVYSWIPMHERGIVQGINFSGSRIGAAITLPLISWLIFSIGWRQTFVVLMFVGFAWSVVWFLLFRDDPADVSWLPDTERDYIVAQRQHPSFASSASRNTDVVRENAHLQYWQKLASSTTVLALCGQYFTSNFIFFFGLTWFFPQLKSRYQLTGLEASVFAAVPMLFGAIGNWFSGWWVDRLYCRGEWTRSRRRPAIVGFLLAAVGTLGCAHASSPWTSAVFFSLTIFGADMTLAPSWTTCIDIGRGRSGLVSGTMNMTGNLGSFATSLAFPYLLAWTGSPLPFFYVAAGLNVTAIGLWLLIDPTAPVEAVS